ncbi:hypothetical protein TNIN_458001 [Trichonephila inaurata madagascariensis]|uniref:Uncharacterized protein n=1 Tax=Trichonephila inaurata madagascariensis TaxID=2747483 RepID=A0A8X6I2H8_9ARAC|nr:hypothetical protein TNIN_458001 [Trichonephila inaurata madagascariensis]
MTEFEAPKFTKGFNRLVIDENVDVVPMQFCGQWRISEIRDLTSYRGRSAKFSSRFGDWLEIRYGVGDRDLVWRVGDHP